MEKHQLYMHRCIELAKSGGGYTAPNPMVGSVIVYDDRIIGEGYHKEYGKAHAEVNCINSVKQDEKHLIEKAVLYVSLEPCAHFGKTPPCADYIINHNIKKVVVGCRDPFIQVNGRGIEKLQSAGVEVIAGVMEDECKKLNKRFFTFHTEQRPYIILKWVQSKNQQIANADYSRVLISNNYTNRLVHKWRCDEAGIMVGTNTALHDNPSLNTRHSSGPDPVRLIIDMNLRLPLTLQIFDRKQKTIVFNDIRNEEHENLIYYKIDKESSVVQGLLNACCKLNIQSILLEGGTKLIQSFIDESMWDEARVIENTELVISNGLPAPVLCNYKFVSDKKILTDLISYYTNKDHDK